MNILALHNNYPATTLSNVDSYVCYTLPETAVQKNGKPVFLPDYANPAALEVHLAIRICRLGRSISMRFAHRYYDAITALPHFFSMRQRLKDCLGQWLWDLTMRCRSGIFFPLRPA